MPISASADITLTNTYVDTRVKYLLPLLESLTQFKPTKRRTGGKGINYQTEENEFLKGWETLAMEQQAHMMAYYPDTTGKDEYGTCLRQVTALKKALRHAVNTDIMDKANRKPLITVISHFGNDLSKRFQVYKAKQNIRVRNEVANRSLPENRIDLDVSPFIQKAFKVLATLDQLESSDWKQVSCALALATGRRMVEIHCTASFRVIDEHTVGFKGYAKGKSREIDGVAIEDYEFTIPVLVPAQLVIDGLAWLSEHGKRVEDKPQVNRKYSRYLSETVKKDWAILPVEDMTYHKFRGAYFGTVVAKSGINPMDYMNYARNILGDNDEETIRHYQRFNMVIHT